MIRGNYELVIVQGNDIDELDAANRRIGGRHECSRSFRAKEIDLGNKLIARDYPVSKSVFEPGLFGRHINVSAEGAPTPDFPDGALEQEVKAIASVSGPSLPKA